MNSSRLTVLPRVDVRAGATDRARTSSDAPGEGADRSRNALMSVEGLTVTYRSSVGDVVAVDDVDLDIAPGERVALVGESGSGKTAVCLAIAGFMPRAGESEFRRMEFAGRPLVRTPRALPAQTPGLAMVFQDAMTSLDPVATIGSQLVAVMRARGMARKEAKARARDWLVRVGLADTERVLRARSWELSGGMRQRAMLALALCGEPQLLIADEPTSALDASLARDAMELLVDLTGDTGTSLLIVSHDIGLCQRYSDRTVVMYGGKVVEELESARLASGAQHPYTVALLNSVPSLENAELDELPTIALPSIGPPPTSGCRFRARCPVAFDRCEDDPPAVELSARHAVRCWAPVSLGHRGDAPGTAEGGALA